MLAWSGHTGVCAYDTGYRHAWSAIAHGCMCLRVSYTYPNINILRAVTLVFYLVLK